MKKIIFTAVMACLAAASVIYLCSQPSPGAGPSGAGRAAMPGGGGLGQLNAPRLDLLGSSPDKTGETGLQRLKTALNATDEEWKSIEPLLKDVLDKQSGLRSPAAEVLRQALEYEASPTEIEYILSALRDDRRKTQERLRKVLTIHQEAQLVLIGILD